MSKRISSLLSNLRGSQNRGRSKAEKRAARTAHAACYRPVVQELESRVLLDGNLSYTFPASSTIHALLREAPDTGVNQVQIVDRDTGSILTQQASSSTTGIDITGMDDGDSLKVDSSVPSSLSVSVDDVVAAGSFQSVGSFLSITDGVLSVPSTGIVNIAADSASVTLGTLTGTVTDLTASYTSSTHAFDLSAAQVSVQIGDLLSGTASGVHLSYTTDGSAHQKLGTLNSLSATLTPLNNATVTLNGLDIYSDGFTLANGSVTASSVDVADVIQLTNPTVTFDDVSLTIGAGTTSVTGTVHVSVDSAVLFPEESSFFSATVSDFVGSYDVATNNLTLDAGEVEIAVSDVVKIEASGAHFQLDPLMISFDSVSAESSRFSGLAGEVDGLTITKDGFQVDGSVTLRAATEEPVHLGSIFTFSNLALSLSHFGYSIESGAHFGADSALTVSADSVELNVGESVEASAEGIAGSIGLGSENLGHFTFHGESVAVNVGSHLKLGAHDISFNTNPEPEEYIAEFGSLDASVHVGGFTVTGSGQNFAIGSDGSFVTLPGFGVSLSTSADVSKLQWPKWLPIPTIESLTIQWPNFAADRSNFTMDLSASIDASLPGFHAITISGFVHDLIIDTSLLQEDKFPIVSVGGVGIDAEGELFGTHLKAGFFFAVARLDKDGLVIPDDDTTTIVDQSIFYGGVDGEVEIAGVGGFELRLGLSEVGPLEGFVRIDAPVIIDPLPPNFALRDFRAGIQFNHSLPDITDARQLATETEFQPQSDLTLEQWREELLTQVVSQVSALTTHPNLSVFDVLANPVTLHGGGTFFLADASAAAFKADGDILLSTDGKLFASGTITLGSRISLGGKIYANFSHVADGQFTLLMDAEVPEASKVLTIYGGLHFDFGDGDETPTTPLRSFTIDITGGMELSGPGVKGVHVDGDVKLNIVPDDTSLSVLATVDGSLSIDPLGHALDVNGSMTLQFSTAGVQAWGAWVVTPGELDGLADLGLTVDGFALFRFNTDSLEHSISLDTGTTRTSYELSPSSMSFYASGLATVEEAGATLFHIDGALTATFVVTHVDTKAATDKDGHTILDLNGHPIQVPDNQYSLDVLADGTVIIGDQSAPIAKLDAIGYMHVSTVDGIAAQIDAALAPGGQLSSFGISLSATLFVELNTHGADITYHVPSDFPTPIGSLHSLAGSKVTIPGAPVDGQGNRGTDGPYLNIRGTGALKVQNVYNLNGSFSLLVAAHSLTASFSSSMGIGALGNFAASGSLLIVDSTKDSHNNPQAGGAYGYLSLGSNLTKNIDGVALGGTFTLEVNTTGISQALGNGDSLASGSVQVKLTSGSVQFSPSIYATGEFSLTIGDSSTSLDFRNVQVQVSPLASFGASGSMTISSAGVVGMVTLTVVGGKIDRGTGYSFSGAFTLTVDTTLSTPLVQAEVSGHLLVGSFDINGTFTVTSSDNGLSVAIDGTLGLGSVGSIPVHSKMTINTDGIFGSLPLSTSPLKAGGFKLQVTSAAFKVNTTGLPTNGISPFKAYVSIAGLLQLASGPDGDNSFGIEGSFTLTVQQGIVSILVDGDMDLGSLGALGVNGALSASSAGTWGDLLADAHSLPNAKGFSANGFLQLEVNTTSSTKTIAAYPVNASTGAVGSAPVNVQLDAKTVQLDIGGKLTLAKSFTLNGEMFVTMANGDVSAHLNANASVFNLTVTVSGNLTVHSDGGIDGSLSVTAGDSGTLSFASGVFTISAIADFNFNTSLGTASFSLHGPDDGPATVSFLGLTATGYLNIGYSSGVTEISVPHLQIQIPDLMQRGGAAIWQHFFHKDGPFDSNAVALTLDASGYFRSDFTYLLNVSGAVHLGNAYSSYDGGTVSVENANFLAKGVGAVGVFTITIANTYDNLPNGYSTDGDDGHIATKNSDRRLPSYTPHLNYEYKQLTGLTAYGWGVGWVNLTNNPTTASYGILSGGVTLEVGYFALSFKADARIGTFGSWVGGIGVKFNIGQPTSTYTPPPVIDSFSPSGGYLNGAPVTIISQGTTITPQAVAHVPSAPNHDLTYSYDLFDRNGNFLRSGSSFAGLTPGTYEVRVSAKDDKNARTTSQSVSLIVTDLPPTITRFNAPTNLNPGQAISASVGYTTPAGNNETANWTVYSHGTHIVSGTGTSFSYTPSAPGQYVVTVVVSDLYGGSATQSKTITVANPTTGLTFTNNGPVLAGAPFAVTFAGGLYGLTYSYDFSNDGRFTEPGDVFNSTNTLVTSTFAQAGTYTIHGRVSNSSGGFSDYYTAVKVVNASTGLSFHNSGPVVEGSSVTVSFVGALTGLKFSYDFGNDGRYTDPGDVSNSTSASASFTFQQAGTYTIRGRATNAADGFTDYTTSVTVTNPTIGLDFTSNEPVPEGDQLTVSFAGVAIPLLYSYDFQNDGIFEVVNSSSASVPFTFAEEGAYTIHGRAAHAGGSATDYFVTVTVTDPAVLVQAMGTHSVEGATTGTVTVATFTDPGLSEAASHYQASIDWGDGQTTTGVVVASGGTFSVQGSHTYLEDGSYTITVSIDHGLAPTGTSQATAVVDDAPLTINGTSIGGVEGPSSNLVTVATFVDQGPAEDLSQFAAEIVWGDDTFSPGTIVRNGNVFSVQGIHSFSEEGSFTATVTILHSGLIYTGQTTVVIADAPLSVTAQNITPVEGLNAGVGKVLDASNSSPIVITTDSTAGLTTGETVTITGIRGNTAANGIWTLTTIDGTHFSLADSTGNGTYLDGGLWMDGPSSITAASNSSPIVIMTDNVGNLVDGDTVTIAGIQGNTAANGTWTISHVTDNGFTLVGSTGNGAYARGGSWTRGGLTVATFLDTGGPESPADYRASINWGDGTTSPGIIVRDPRGDGFFVQGAHIYQEEGIYSITTTVAHDLLPAITVYSTATVVDAPLTASPVTLNAVQGQPLSSTVASHILVARFTDADPTATLADFNASINWGDGATTSGVIAYDSMSQEYLVWASTDHLYTQAGTYGVSVTITDVGGARIVAASQAVIEVAELLPDPTAPGQWMLAIGGTTQSDTIRLATGSSLGEELVTLNGSSLGAFHPTSRTILFGQTGDDGYEVDAPLAAPVAIYAGTGTSSLYANGAQDPSAQPAYFTVGAGRNALNVVADPAGDAFRIGNHYVSVASGQNGTPISILLTNIASMTVHGGSGHSTYTIAENAVPASLFGDNGNNSFLFDDGASITGSLVGGTGGGINTIDWSRMTAGRNIQLTTVGSPGYNGTEASIGGGFQNINAFVGSSGGNTLAGPNSANLWNITGINAGRINDRLSFRAIQSLTGNGVRDTFAFKGTADVTGRLQGGSGREILDYSQYATPVDVTLTRRGTTHGVQGTTAGATNYFDNIDEIDGNASSRLESGAAPALFTGDFDTSLLVTGFASTVLHIQGNFSGSLNDATPGSTQDLTIDGSVTGSGSLIAGAVTQLSIGGSETSTGRLTVGSVGTLSIGGTVAGQITSAGSIGAFTIGQSVASTATIQAGSLNTMTVGPNHLTPGDDMAGILQVTGTLTQLRVAGGMPGTISAGHVGTIGVYGGYGPYVLQIQENGIWRRVEAATPDSPYPLLFGPRSGVSPDGVTIQYYYESASLANPQLTAKVTNKASTAADQFDLSLVTYNDVAKFNLARLDAAGVSGIRNVAVEGDILTAVSAPASSFFTVNGVIDGSPAGVWLPADALAGVAARDFVPNRSIRAGSIQAIAFGSHQKENGVIETGIAAKAEDAAELLNSSTAIVQANDTFRVAFADLATQQVGFFVDSTKSGGHFDDHSIDFSVQNNNGVPSSSARGAVTALIGVAKTYDSHGKLSDSVIQTVDLRGDGGSFYTEQAIAQRIASTGPLGDVSVESSYGINSLTAPSIFGSVDTKGAITGLAQTTGQRTDPITGAVTTVSADWGRVYSVPTKSGSMLVPTTINAKGINGQLVSRGNLISQLTVDGGLAGVVAVQGTTGSMVGSTRLGGILVNGGLSGQIVGLGADWGDLVIHGGLKGGRIAYKDDMMGNVVIDGSLDATSALVCGGSIGSAALGTTLKLSDVKGIVAAKGNLLTDKPVNSKQAAYYQGNVATTDTVSAAAIDALFTDQGKALSFDTNGQDLNGLSLLLTDLLALTTKNGKLSGTKA